MTPSELLATLRKLGISKSQSTLNTWVRNGLICQPERKAAGRGRGSYSDYPPEAVGEAAAAAWLLEQGVAPALVKQIRDVATCEYQRSDIPVEFKPGLAYPESELCFHQWTTIVSFFDKRYPLWRYHLYNIPQLIRLWIVVCKRAMAGERVADVPLPMGSLVLKRTERGTYRFDIVRWSH